MHHEWPHRAYGRLTSLGRIMHWCPLLATRSDRFLLCCSSWFRYATSLERDHYEACLPLHAATACCSSCSACLQLIVDAARMRRGGAGRCPIRATCTSVDVQWLVEKAKSEGHSTTHACPLPHAAFRAFAVDHWWSISSNSLGGPQSANLPKQFHRNKRF